MDDLIELKAGDAAYHVLRRLKPEWADWDAWGVDRKCRDPQTLEGFNKALEAAGRKAFDEMDFPEVVARDELFHLLRDFMSRRRQALAGMAAGRVSEGEVEEDTRKERLFNVLLRTDVSQEVRDAWGWQYENNLPDWAVCYTFASTIAFERTNWPDGVSYEDGPDFVRKFKKIRDGLLLDGAAVAGL